MSEIKPGAQPHLSFEMKHRAGALEIDTGFELTRPWTILFGPSGSGKSTLLRAIAGLLRPDQARIAIRWKSEMRVVVDTSGGIWVPPHRRPVRWAAQNAAIFPHMSVRENLGFASEMVGAGLEAEVDKVIDRFGLARIEGRKPLMLSGGEQKRVAIARAAIAANGRLLLLDEPFTGLDAPRRDELLTDLQLWATQTRTPILSVTHDLSEAFQVDGEVLKLHEGRLIAQGSAAIVLAEERHRLVMQLQDCD